MPEPVDPSRTAATPHDQPPSAASGADETAAAASRANVASAPLFGPPTGVGEVGTLGPYRVLKELGKGGMGAVFLALDTRLNRKLAFKVMLPEYAADISAKERFLREARAAAQISHDNVVTVFEADERDGVPYIAMQYLQGYPLDEYLKTKGVPPLPHVLRIARETALGLAAAHALGLVHRDIKPANLWLETPNGRVKVLDFGLARAVDAEAELTKSGAVVGTPAYMSPEQARGQKVDSRTDLFSLGGVLYRLCTGKTPFSGPNVMAVLMALGSDDPTPVRELNPNVPEALAALIHQLLAKKADDRPQSANEVAKRLRAILEQLATPAAPVPMPAAVPMASAADISNSMPVVVNPVPVQPPVVSQMQISVQPESAFENLDAKAEANNATHIEPTFDKELKPGPKKSGKGLLIAAGVAVLLAVIAGGVIVSQMGKKNEPKAPEGGTPTPGDKGKPAPKVNPEPVKPGPVGTDWVDLLALDQTWFEVPSGTWEKRDGKWTSAHLGGPRNLLGFPLTATGSYELEGELTLDKGSDSLAFMLPIGRQSVQFGFNLKSDPLPTIAGLHLVNGTPGHSQANPTLTAHDTFKVGERIKLAMSVRIKGDQVEFAATVGQIKPIRWTGPVVQLSRDTSLQIPNDRFGIEAFASQYTLHKLRFRKIDGEAMILKPKAESSAVPPKAWVPPAAVAVGASPFDKLDPREIPAADRFDWQPKELVAVAGTHSPRTWNRADGGFAISPDGSLVGTGGTDGTMRVWDVKTQKLKVNLPYGGFAVAFGADGTKIYAAFGGRWILDLTKPSEQPTEWKDGPPPARYPTGLWFTPDNSVAVIHDEISVSVWDLTPKPAKEVAKFPMDPHHSAVVTPDVKRMAHYSHAEKVVLVHDFTPTGLKERCRIEVPNSTLAISADGKRLVTTRPGAKRRLWDLTVNPPTFIEFDELIGGYQWDWQMAFSPDGKRLVTHNPDLSLALWDTTGAIPKEAWAKPFPVFGLGDGNWHTRVGFAGEGGNTLVVFSGLGLVHFIDVSGAEPKWLNPIEPTEPAGGGIAFEGNTGRVSLLRAADQRYQWWDFGKAKPAPVDVVAPPGTVAFTPDGGKQTVWDGKTGMLSLVVGGKPVGPLPGMQARGTLTADGKTYWGMNFPDGGDFSRAGTLKGWDVSGAAPRENHSITLATGPPGAWQLSLHRNDTVLACNYGKLTFWDLTAAEPRLLSTFPGSGGPGVYVFPDGERVLAVGDGNALQLWQATARGWVKAWEDVAALHYHAVISGVGGKVVAAHPSGQWFAVHNHEKSEVAIRRSSDGSVVQKFPLKAPPHDVAFAPDGRHLFVANGFGTVYVLRLNELIAAAPAADRAAAEWVLSVGGKLWVKTAEGQKEVAAAKDLPAGPVTLEGVLLRQSRATDADLERLKHLADLYSLDLNGMKVADAGLEHIGMLPNLKYLYLVDTKVSNDGLAHLKRLTTLTALELTGTAVADAGLDHLAALAQLAALDLRGTQVTADGVAKLAMALPRCKITWDGGTIEPAKK